LTTATLTRVPVIALPEVEVLPEQVEAPEEEACYICGGRHYTECEACEKVICKRHTHEYMSPCIALRTHCPSCYGKKQRGEL